MMMEHVEVHRLLSLAQKAMRKGQRGLPYALIADHMLAEEATEDERNLSVEWLDYRKAYDMVPHRCIRKVLKEIDAPWEVQSTVKQLIPIWKMDVTRKNG